MKLYTRGGDDGTTGLFGGKRVSKSDPRVCAYGEVDELNAALGLVVAAGTDDALSSQLRQIQAELFALGAELANPDARSGSVTINQQQVSQLERWIDEASDAAPPLRTFVIPAGTAAAAGLHFTRAVCRRAERAVILLGRAEPVQPAVVQYLNRLSDLLFALARRANHQAGVPDVPWVAPRE